MLSIIWKSFFTNWRKGELARRDYAICLLVWLLIAYVIPPLLIHYIEQLFFLDDPAYGWSVIFIWLFWIALTLPFLLNMVVKRIRDTGLPGWFSLVVIFIFKFLLIYLTTIIPLGPVREFFGSIFRFEHCLFLGDCLHFLVLSLVFLIALFLPSGCFVRSGKTREDGPERKSR